MNGLRPWLPTTTSCASAECSSSAFIGPLRWTLRVTSTSGYFSVQPARHSDSSACSCCSYGPQSTKRLASGIPAQRGVLVPRVDRNQRCAEERGKFEGMRDGEFAELAPVDADDDGPGVGHRVITRTAEYGHGTVRAVDHPEWCRIRETRTAFRWCRPDPVQRCEPTSRVRRVWLREYRSRGHVRR